MSAAKAQAAEMQNNISDLSSAAQGFLGSEHRMLIDGSWVGAASGETFAVIDPTSGREVARAPAGDAQDIDAAVLAARRAFDIGP